MGAIAAIIGSGCCCDGQGEPCDCTLSAVTVTWSGNYRLGYSYDSEICGVPEAGYIMFVGEVSLTSFEVVCERTELPGCPFIGEHQEVLQLSKHSGGLSDYYLRVRFIVQVYRLSPDPTRWKVHITVLVAVTNADGTSGLGFSCIPGENWDEWYFQNPEPGLECPPFDSYEPLFEGCYCCCGSEPWCGGATEVFGTIFDRPGQFECDLGSVSVS